MPAHQQAVQDPRAQVPERRQRLALSHPLPQELWMGGQRFQDISENVAGSLTMTNIPATQRRLEDSGS